ncbi:MAG: hypothetical protein [Wigfec virus K19_152]|nr:MAG: hypothetical protein [Wigfec virus K19_152]
MYNGSKPIKITIMKLKVILQILTIALTQFPQVIRLLELIKSKDKKALINFLIDWSILLMDEINQSKTIDDWKEEQQKIAQLEVDKEETVPH